VAKYAADFMQANGAKKIGIIGINDLHGIEFTGRVQSELSQRGMDVVVGPELYPLTVTDLSPIIKKLQAANVDTLWASTYPADGTLLVKQMMALGYSPRIMFMGPGSQYPLVMLPTFGAAAMTGIMEYHGFEVDYTTSPELMALAEKYKAAAGGYPGSNTIATYVCYQCLFDAVEQVGLDRTKIRDLLKTGTFKTVLGDAKWNWDICSLDVPGAGYLAEWQGGEMLKVVWPADRATAPWIPKPAWPAQ
jgi:branched-chain amino acid transport system substrate-binding protein